MPRALCSKRPVCAKVRSRFRHCTSIATAPKTTRTSARWHRGTTGPSRRFAPRTSRFLRCSCRLHVEEVHPVVNPRPRRRLRLVEVEARRQRLAQGGVGGEGGGGGGELGLPLPGEAGPHARAAVGGSVK